MLKIYIYFIACLFLGFEMIAQTSLPGLPVDTPPGYECCEDLAPPSGQMEDASQEYLDCINSPNPSEYCNPVSIDNSIYILMAGVSGVVLASLAMYKKVKYKKTPM